MTVGWEYSQQRFSRKYVAELMTENKRLYILGIKSWRTNGEAQLRWSK
jgi:hypothetical protein